MVPKHNHNLRSGKQSRELLIKPQQSNINAKSESNVNATLKKVYQENSSEGGEEE